MFQRRRSRSVARLPAVIAMLSARSAFAQSASTDCPHVVPNGAHYYPSTGEVYVHNMLVATYEPWSCLPAPQQAQAPEPAPPSGPEPLVCLQLSAECDAGDQCSCTSGAQCNIPEQYVQGRSGNVCCGIHTTACTSDLDCCSQHDCGWSNQFCWEGNWAEFAQSHANLGTGLENPAEYEFIGGSWTVPDAPVVTDINRESFWIGFEDSTQAVILQPVLAYDHTFNGGAGGWEIIAEALGSTTDWEPASPNDIVHGTVQLESGDYNNLPETWKVYIWDETNGNSATLYATLEGSGWGPIQTVLGGVLEVQGIAACAGLPDNNSMLFTLDGLDQENSSGTGGVSVLATQGWHLNYNSLYPNCGWGAPTWDTYGTYQQFGLSWRN